MKQIMLDYDEVTGSIYYNNMVIYTYLGIPIVEEEINKSSNIDSSTIIALFNSGISIGDILALKDKALL